MNNGPMLNNYKLSLNTRDPLGILGVSQGIVNDICPIITSVTPNAFYWVFLNWVFYDYYVERRLDIKSKITIDDYVKTLNFFMILGNRLNGVYCSGMSGNSAIEKLLDEGITHYSYNSNYIKNLTVIYYYRGALSTARFISDEDKDGNKLDHIIYLNKGVNLANSVHKLVKNTDFYKSYILNNKYDNVPRDVIKEFAEIMSFDMDKIPLSKQLLVDYFFGSEPKLKIQEKLIKHFYYTMGMKNINEREIRKYLFSFYSPRWDNNDAPRELKEAFIKWEALVNRHYFVTSLYKVFSFFMLHVETKKYSQIIESLVADLPDILLEDYMDNNRINADEIEQFLNMNIRNNNDIILNFLKVISSIYYSMYERNDIKKTYLESDNFGTSISMMTLFNDIDRFKHQSIKDFASYVIKNYIIFQHVKTARRKMLYGNNNYYFTVENDLIYKVNNQPLNNFGLQGLRIDQTFLVMKKLDMLED